MAQGLPEIPVETYQAARKVYNLQHIYLRIGDHLGEILPKIDLALLDPSADGSANEVFRLGLVTAFQYAELLPDPAASEATLHRMDWKYALYLPAKHPGISATSLCHFRRNLLSHPRSISAFAQLLDETGEHGLFSREVSSQLNPLEALNTVCNLTRLANLQRAMRAALSMLGTLAPGWLRANALPHWYNRFKTGQLNPAASISVEEMEEKAVRLGEDFLYLITTLEEQGLTALSSQTEIQEIARLLKDEFTVTGKLVDWRLASCTSCASGGVGLLR